MSLPGPAGSITANHSLIWIKSLPAAHVRGEMDAMHTLDIPPQLITRKGNEAKTHKAALAYCKVRSAEVTVGKGEFSMLIHFSPPPT